MKTKEELLAMSHEDLANYACKCQSDISLYEYYKRQYERMKEILSAIGIIYETYKRESNG